MVAGMSAVAALSEGEVERILEREAMALNMGILNNRCGDILRGHIFLAITVHPLDPT